LIQDFFVSVLGSSATKREAKSYIQRFTPPKPPVTTPISVPQLRPSSPKPGVNLGSFYAPAAVEESPKFVRHSQTASQSLIESQVHVALIKIRAPQCLEEETLNGVGRTLSQLGRLGLGSVVVVDCDASSSIDNTISTSPSAWKTLAKKEAGRVAAAIDSNCDTGARLVEDVIGVPDDYELSQSSVRDRTSAYVTLRQLLITPLKRGLIPVIRCVAHTDTSQVSVPITGADAVLALSRELAGIGSDISHGADPYKNEETLKRLRDEVSLDRLIILDPLGGIPSSQRPSGYHVFLNMEQEFEPAQRDLLQASKVHESSTLLQSSKTESIVSDLGSSNPLSSFVEMEFGGKTSASSKPNPSGNELAQSSSATSGFHLKNLELVRSVLSILPPSSSAILTTPNEAANSAKISALQPGGVGTRRQRNPLIHNLLTDKPVYSSSLPSGRLGYSENARTDIPYLSATGIIPTTFAKHGIPVVITPNPADTAWEATVPGRTSLRLTDPQIDLSRLVHLIDDSFDRKLDVEDYLKRVNDRIAGVIIAGEYEGAAILTWETPPGVMDDSSPESRARMVPYLDKFAVLKRAQGSGGVADIVFTAMVRDCFPNGVVWRSRTTNVVNKWYFERSRGTWKLPNTGWTMFWTTPGMSRRTFLDYEGVCRGIVPSWADKKAVLD
jgi:amino-acid N-acetyltransferase